MANCKTEYRINKKGCEFFRTANFEEAKAKLDELSAKRPGVFSIQSRSCRCNKYGVMETVATVTKNGIEYVPSWDTWK